MTFSKVLSRCALLLLLSLSLNASAQSGTPGITDVTMSMLNWIKHLDSEADKFVTKEKAPQLKQYFEDLKQDLKIYMKTRKTLSDSIFRNNIGPGKKDVFNFETLKQQMSTVMGRMRDVTDLTSKELRAEGDKLNDDLYNVLYGDKNEYLSALEAFLAGHEVTKKDLALDGSTCYNRLEQCVNLITGIQAKIDRKAK